MKTKVSENLVHVLPAPANPQSKHTPGKWEAIEAKFGWLVEAPGSEPSSRVSICTIHETNLRTDKPDRAEHDAKLIASAPDLARQLDECREALKRAYVALEKSVHFETGLAFWRKGGDGYAAMLEARAALATESGVSK